MPFRSARARSPRQYGTTGFPNVAVRRPPCRARSVLRGRGTYVPDAGSIISRLNASTRHFHADVDDPWLALLSPTVGLSDYLGVLIRMYGLLAPFESACKYTPGLARLVDIRQQTRAGFVERGTGAGLGDPDLPDAHDLPLATRGRWMALRRREVDAVAGGRSTSPRQTCSADRARL